MKLAGALLALTLPICAQSEQKVPADPKAKPAPEAPAEKTVKQTVEELARKQFRADYKESSAVYDGKGWAISVTVKETIGSAAGLQRSIVALAAVCHPPGFVVSDFSVAARSDFPDGLGNKQEGPLVRVNLRKEVAAKINWNDPNAIDFHKAFETTFVHSSFKNAWDKSDVF